VDPELAELLDRSALRNGVGILGTGVNPGFVLDRLPATLGAVVGEVRRVDGLRVVDVSRRRPALQEKVGIGLTPEEFEEQAEEGTVGHVGLSESCALLVDGLGLVADEIEEEIDPLVAETAVNVGGVQVEAGRVYGLRQVAMAFDEGREVARLTLELGLGLENPRDNIRIEADPPVEMTIHGGIDGDRATAWALVNAAPRVAAAEPGLLTVLDLPAGR
jgi:4-hydroxy-tetrahydrodipicolinate reductase